MSAVISPTIQNEIFVVLLEVIELDDDKCESRITNTTSTPTTNNNN